MASLLALTNLLVVSRLLISLTLFHPGACQTYPYQEKYITQFVDHFNYRDQRTYQERYLLTGKMNFPYKNTQEALFSVGYPIVCWGVGGWMCGWVGVVLGEICE